MKITQYKTRLEDTDREFIPALLNAKLEATAPNTVADYVALSIENLQSANERMKQAIDELKSRIEANKQQENIIKVSVAEWLSDVGIDKLQGDIVSSVSIRAQKPKTSVKVINEESLINQGYFKTTLDKTAVKQAIENGADVDGAVLEIEHLEDTLSINKRKKKQAVEVENKTN